MATRTINRRSFVKRSAAAVAAIGVPALVPARVLGNSAPSDLLRVGCIGVGRMGHGDMQECLIRGLDASTRAHVVAVCDLDRLRAEHAKHQVESFYQNAPKVSGPVPSSIDVYGDYRELLARDDLDAVTISTPDHWHALVAIAAAERGKAVYLQKPLTYTVAEGQKLVSAVRKNRVVLQTGSQQRSDRRFHRACELVRNGRIGKLHTISILLPTDEGTGDATPMPVPENLNYEMWLGPTPEQPYTQDRVHPQSGFSRPGWLQIESYCRGMITGWGAHMFDIAQWGHGSDDSGLVEVEATAEFPHRGLFDVHTTFRAEGRYADGVKLLAASGEPAGVRFDGDAGWIRVSRGKLEAEPREILNQPIGANEVQLQRSHNHMSNFLQSVRMQQDPICPVEVGHRSNTLCVITHLAMKLGRKLHWDPNAESFVDDPEANALLDYEHRPPWTI
jgi:predicted dehydrogenase